MGRIDSVQYRPALAITGCWQVSNRNKLYDELGWESLSDRRWPTRLIHFYKIFRNSSPKYLYEHIPSLRIPIYGNSSPNIIHEIRCRTRKYMNSFFPNCVKSWNNIDDELRNSEALDRFKSNLLSLIRPAKKDIFGIKNIFRLRLGHSQLKVHKKRRDFLNTPFA